MLAKTQLQTQSKSQPGVGFQHHHAGGVDAIKSLYRSGGVQGLYRGATGSIARVCVASGVQLSAYSSVMPI